MKDRGSMELCEAGSSRRHHGLQPAGSDDLPKSLPGAHEACVLDHHDITLGLIIRADGDGPAVACHTAHGYGLSVLQNDPLAAENLIEDSALAADAGPFRGDCKLSKENRVGLALLGIAIGCTQERISERQSGQNHKQYQ